ncbi:MAG: C-terminal binding protein [Geminicoccaceae bacterium]
MLVLLPDAQFDDDAEIEREVLGDAAQFALHHEVDALRIPDEHWRRADAVIVYYGVPVDRELIERLDSCRILVRAGVGYDHIDIDACAARGIPVCNVPDYGTTEVADHAIALMLALARGLVSYHARLLADPLAGWHWSGAPLVRRLRGGTFGVVGMGRIGTAASRRARALDMEVCFYDPYLPDGTELGLGYRRADSLHALLAESDVVSLHCPLTSDNRNMIDEAALRALKPGALLINTARGGLVDLGALEAALHAGRLGGAGLDVLPEEPPDPEHPLIQAFRRREPGLDGRLLLTPHVAWFSAAGRADLRRKSAETARDFLARGRLRNCVNRTPLEVAERRGNDQSNSQ